MINDFKFPHVEALVVGYGIELIRLLSNMSVLKLSFKNSVNA